MSTTDRDLILYWALDTVSASRVADKSGWANNGLVRGNLTVIPDTIFGACMHFPGATGDSITLNQMLDFPEGEISVCCWVKPSVPIQKGTLLSYATSEQSRAFALFDMLNLKVSIGGDENLIGVGLSDRQWHHIAVCWRSNNGQIVSYQDGDLMYQGVFATGESIHSGGSLVIGQDQILPGDTSSPTQTFAGEMANLRIYRRLLSPSQVEQVRLADVVQVQLIAPSSSEAMQLFSPSQVEPVQLIDTASPEVDHAAI